MIKNPSDGFFTFGKINMYGLEYFKSMCHELLGRISVTLLPSG